MRAKRIQMPSSLSGRSSITSRLVMRSRSSSEATASPPCPAPTISTSSTGIAVGAARRYPRCIRVGDEFQVACDVAFDSASEVGVMVLRVGTPRPRSVDGKAMSRSVLDRGWNSSKKALPRQQPAVARTAQVDRGRIVIRQRYTDPVAERRQPGRQTFAPGFERPRVLAAML